MDERTDERKVEIIMPPLPVRPGGGIKIARYLMMMMMMMMIFLVNCPSLVWSPHKRVALGPGV